MIDGVGRGRNDARVHLVAECTGALLVGDHEVALRVGDGVLTSVPLTIRASRAVLVSVYLPRTVLGGADAESGASMLVLQNSLVAPVMAFATGVGGLDPDDIGSFGVYYVERLLQEMMLCLTVQSQRSRQLRPIQDVFTAARAIIVAQCTDPELRAESVARDVRLSLRQLQRVFHAHGTTVDREVRRARVNYAVGLLTDPQYTSLSIAQIANYSGYASRASLTRAMAVEGAGTPTSRRKGLRSTGGGRRNPEAPSEER